MTCGPGTVTGEMRGTLQATGRRQTSSTSTESKTPRAMLDIRGTPIRSRQKTRLTEATWHYPQSADPRRQGHRTHHQG